MTNPVTDFLERFLDAGEILITPGLEVAEGYVPLPLRRLNVNREVPFNVYFKMKKRGHENPHFIKGCARGEVYLEEWHQKLLRLRIPCVYVTLEEMHLVMHYVNHYLELTLKEDVKSNLEKGVQVCDVMQLWTMNFFNNEEARTAEEVRVALKFLGSLLPLIHGDDQSIWDLMKIGRHKSTRLYAHCLNVCLLGMAFTGYLGWRREKILGFGLGALIHDIGLARVPLAILEKKGGLTPEEMLKIKRHPIDGGRMVQGFANLRWEALQMVLQHHENGDGTGYPLGLKTPHIHTWARVCRILDSYEAMTHKRSWREAMDPIDAIWTMHSDWKKSKLFDQNYLAAFIKFLAGG
ncbi:MAG: HD domain-containing protein [Deltaproteobacteria bacterium]|nr:MAG: HD domain-containing protein [Deltaproteobacteria bacterium]